MTAVERATQEYRERALRNRKNGEAFEFKVLKRIRRTSLVASRSAGSHSLIDITAVTKKGTELISCKTNGYHAPDELRALQKLANDVPSNTIVKIAYYISKRKYIIRTLKRQGR